MNTKLLRNLGIASAVVIVTIFGIGFVEQEQKIDPYQNEIDTWIECINTPGSFIQESYPGTCRLGEDRVIQPIIPASESQWQECISADEVIVVDERGERPDRCITPDNVVFVEP